MSERIDRLKWILHRRQQLRILFCDDREQLKPEAARFFAWLHRFCYADRPSYKQNPISGAIDPNATHVAEGRREVWNELQRLLKIDTAKIIQEIEKLREEETWPTQQ